MKERTGISVSDISDATSQPLSSSRYIKPVSIELTQQGVVRQWHALDSFDAVACLVYDRSKQAVVLVRQFRPAAYWKESDRLQNQNDESKARAITYELCAGLMDKAKPPAQTMKEELFEEMGIDIDLSRLEKVKVLRGSFGIAAPEVHVFFAEVVEQDYSGKGGGLKDDGEFIANEYVPVDKIQDLMDDDDKLKPSGLMYVLMWFLHCKYKQIQK